MTAAVYRDWVSIIASDTGEKLDRLDLFCKYCRRVKMNKLFIRNYRVMALLIKLARVDAKKYFDTFSGRLIFVDLESLITIKHNII